MNAAPTRPKRLRFRKQVSVAGMNETKVDDITTDIIIPRERVISICNLDKDALDDYLNEGDNSQEQEAELLQYFQPTSSTATTTVTSNEGSEALSVAATASVSNVVSSATVPMISTTATANGPYPAMRSFPLYQATGLPSDGRTEPQPLPPRQDQINELRQYLQQNLHPGQSAQSGPPAAEQPLPGMGNGIPFSDHPANIPPAIVAQNQFPPTAQPAHLTQMEKQKLNINTHNMPQLMRSISASGTVGINLQSPNSRRKNFSFVPISPGPQSPRVFPNHVAAGNNMNASLVNPVTNIAMQSSPFVSPRATPALRKPINKDLTTCLTSLANDPLIGSVKTAFSKPYSAKSDISASAPVSPSMIPHQFHFNSAMVAPYSIASASAATTMSNSQPHHQHQSSCNISGMCPILESRSQSVPLHRQSPGYSTPGPNTAYNSTCNSIAQTPVPSEFADFTDENILNILAETSAEQSIKLEDNDIPTLMDSNGIETMMSEPHGSNLVNMSRSVPSTPLPIRGYRPPNLPQINTSLHHHSMIGSKTVPTTPIAHCNGAGHTPFRYSPEHHRDFLINGNTIDTAKPNHFFPATSDVSRAAITRQHSLPASAANIHSGDANSILPTDQIDELSNYNDVNDPIIAGSDLLHSL